MTDHLSNQKLLLKNHLHHILNHQPLDTQRALITTIAADLGVNIVDCAAALVQLTQTLNIAPLVTQQLLPCIIPATVKMVRYRLDIGSKHQLTFDTLKKVLVEESGVDKNNIQNVSIRNTYTLLDLPDAMPTDIFLHLKTVEINQQKLAIKRIKTRNKKRGTTAQHRPKHRPTKLDNNAPESLTKKLPLKQPTPLRQRDSDSIQ